MQYPFLEGGGEMGELTRRYNWAATALGEPEKWPQSLKTTISIILNSRFPMFLFWGPTHICFYNDAYRPSLGNNGKHPYALGKSGHDIWSEIWGFIKPQIDQVLEGRGASWNEDQLLPIYRNGKMEDTYWTCSYSPVKDEIGEIAGVFVTCTETTSKVKQIAQLEENKNELEFAVESTELGTWELNPLTGKFKANQRLRDWFGFKSNDEITLTDVLNTIDPYDIEHVIFAINEVMKYGSGGYYNINFTILHPETKQERIVNAKGRALFAEDKTAYRFNGTLLDITKQKKDEQALQESESRFRSFIEKTPVATAVFVGEELVIDLANDVMISYWNKGKNVIGKPYRQAVPELDGQGFFERLENILETGEEYTAYGESVDVMIDGALKRSYFNYSFTPLFNEQGEVYAILNMGIDVTQHILARQKVEEAEAHLLAAIELAQLSTWCLDIPAGVIHYSPRFMFWLGFSEKTKNLDEAYNPLPDEYRISVPAAIELAIAPGSSGVYDNEHPIVNRLTGQVRIIHAQALVIYDDAGNAIELRGTAQDITIHRELQTELETQVQMRTEELAAAIEELKAINEELEESNLSLVHSNAELAQYAYVASHDLQEPLRKIRFFSSMLNQKVKLDEESKPLLDKINSSAERMSLLIHDLLDFSRVLKSDSFMHSVDLAEVMHAVANDFELNIQEKQAIIEIGELPIIEAIGLQINQMFYNLLGNALKFSSDQRKPHILIRSKLLPYEQVKQYISKPLALTNYYDITFTDNGIGFEEQYTEQIFEVFKRLHGRELYPGSGIGLALCRRIASNLNGHMYAESEVGKGSVFHLILPEGSFEL